MKPLKVAWHSYRAPLASFTLVALAAGLTACVSPLQVYRNYLSQNLKNEAEFSAAEKSLEENSKDVVLKTKLELERERSLFDALKQADLAVDEGRIQDAEREYAKAARYANTQHPKIVQGMDRIHRYQQSRIQVQRANAQIESGQMESAKLTVLNALTLYPNHVELLKLLRTISQSNMGNSPLRRAELVGDVWHKPISLNMNQAQLSQVLQIFNMETGLNFISDQEVRLSAPVSLNITNALFSDTLRLVLTSQGLDMRVLNASTIFIFPNSEDKQKDYQELLVRSFTVTNGDTAAVAAMLKNVLKINEVYVDPRINRIVVRAPARAIALAEKIIATQDLPNPEVILEVEILEVQRSRLLNLGVQLPSSFSVLPSTGQTALTIESLRSLSIGGILDRSRIGINAVGASVNKVDNNIKLLANPRIRAVHNEKAKIVIGDRLPVITSTTTSGSATTTSDSVTYIDVGLKLEVTPTVFLDDDVGIKINMEVSNVTNSITTAKGTVTYQVSTRSADTSLRLHNGETQMLAGLIQSTDRKSSTGIPVVGDIPILGELFNNHNNSDNDTEVVLLITPKIVRNFTKLQSDEALFSSGSERRLDEEGLYLRVLQKEISKTSNASATNASANGNFNLPSGYDSPNGTPQSTQTSNQQIYQRAVQESAQSIMPLPPVAVPPPLGIKSQ